MAAELTSPNRWARRFPVISPPSIGRKLGVSYRSLRSMQGWVTFGLLLLVTLSVVWSVQSANWVESSSLPLLVFAGLMTGVALAKVRLHGLVLHVVAMGVGTLTVLWCAAQLADARPLGQGIAEVKE
ncbi:MAG: hypothetical protein V1724_03150, partial [Chloroflexota bacterium]